MTDEKQLEFEKRISDLAMEHGVSGILSFTFTHLDDGGIDLRLFSSSDPDNKEARDLVLALRGILMGIISKYMGEPLEYEMPGE